MQPLEMNNLYNAIFDRDISTVKELLNQHKNINLNIKNDNNHSPLELATTLDDLTMVKLFLKYTNSYSPRLFESCQIAVKNGCLNILKELFTVPFDINSFNNEGNTLLHLAAEKNNIDIIELLLSKNANPNIKNINNNTPLVMNCRHHNNFNIAKLFIEYGADINSSGSDKRTLLHFAITKSNIQLIDYLIEKGADVNWKTTLGDSPLLIAASTDKELIIDKLIQAGADVNQVDEDNHTPLMTACTTSNFNSIKKLIQAGSLINSINSYGNSALTISCSSKKESKEIVNYLIENGADIHYRKKDFQDPLSLAVKNNNIETVKLLIESGANVHLDYYNQSLLYYSFHSPEITEILISNGLNINHIDEDGNTPLHFAIKFNSFPVVKTLLAHNVDYSIKNNNEKTALDLAFNSKLFDIINLIDTHKSYHELSQSILSKSHVTINNKMKI